MTTININFDIKSIHNAMKQIEETKLKLDTCKVEFLKQCCQWVINEANNNLQQIDIGSGVITEIQNSWENPEIYFNAKDKTYIAKVVNTTDKSVYIEFGVGIVGEQTNYASQNQYNPEMNNYQYNVPSRYKKSDSSWIFKLDDETMLDIKASNFESDRKVHKHTIRTKGQQGELYLYYAINSFIERNIGLQIWNKVKKQLLK